MVGLLMLTGCSSIRGNQDSYGHLKSKLSVSASNDDKATSSVKEKTSLRVKAKTATVRNNTDSQAIWNTQKSTELAAFMKHWGKTMNQAYEAYTPEKQVSFYGDEEPNNSDFIGVNKQRVAVTWSSDGEAKAAGYTLVAVYSDAETAAYADQHLYFFTLYNKRPVVLITMQNQAMPNGLLNFTATQNRDVAQGFADIVNN